MPLLPASSQVQEEAAQKVAEAEQQLGELSEEVQQYRDLNERYRQISEENRQLYNTVQVRGADGLCEQGCAPVWLAGRSVAYVPVSAAVPAAPGVPSSPLPCLCHLSSLTQGPARQHPRVLPSAAPRAHGGQLRQHGGGAGAAVRWLGWRACR